MKSNTHLKILDRRLRFYTFMILLGCLVTGGVSSCANRPQLPVVSLGELDLLSWDAERDGILKLKGDWWFYWDQLLTPVDFHAGNVQNRTGLIKLPDKWNGYLLNSKPLPGHGYATFRLLIKNLPAGSYGLKILDMGTAYKLWVNGHLLLKNGEVGIDRKSMTPDYQPDIGTFRTLGEPVEIVLHVSNFYHRKGGVWKVIEFGTERQIQKKRERELAIQLLIFGSLLIMGLYHLGLYLVRRQERSPLYFGLVSIVVGFRSIITGERYFVWFFPEINWELFQKIEYLSFYLAVPLFFKFVESLFSEVSSLIVRCSYITAAIFSAIVLVTPIRLYSYTVIWYEIAVLVLAIQVVYAIIRATLNGRDGAVWVLIGSVVLFIVFIHDMLAAHELVPPTYLGSAGLFFFIFIQSFMLSIRFSRAFSTVEVMSGRLEEELERNKLMNLNLEKMVKDRTKELNSALDEVQQSNERTISSIQYAQRIQKSLLPSRETVRQIIPNSLVIWQPRDIVGGDLFFVDQYQGGYIVSVLDCTGHGVPGAFMTMLAASSMRRITADEACLDPAQILKRLNRIIKTSLQQDTKYAKSDDGMDASVCFINTVDQTVTFSGANQSLICLRDNGVTTIKGDRHSIGYSRSDPDFEYTSHRIPAKPGLKLYLYTDGIVDQLGGEKRFPLGKKRFADILLQSSTHPFEEQKSIILEALEAYRGENTIQDDITVFGFSI